MQGGSGMALGMLPRRDRDQGRRVVPIDNCWLQDDTANVILRAVGAAAAKSSDLSACALCSIVLLTRALPCSTPLCKSDAAGPSSCNKCMPRASCEPHALLVTGVQVPQQPAKRRAPLHRDSARYIPRWRPRVHGHHHDDAVRNIRPAAVFGLSCAGGGRCSRGQRRAQHRPGGRSHSSSCGESPRPT